MNYKMTWIKMEHRQTTALVTIAILAGVLVVDGTVESGHLVYAYNFSKGKRAIEQPTKIDQNTQCLTAGGNSPIDASCTNTSSTHSTNTGGIGGVRGSTRDDAGISQPTNINQEAICETAGGNSPIDASCTNTANIGTTNTGGIGGVRGSTRDDGGISQSNNIDQKTECETAGGNSGIQGSCINVGGTTSNTGSSTTSNTGSSTTSNTGSSTTSNTGSSTTSNTGSSTTSNTGSSTGSIELPFGGFP
jgi:hypothetical protein